MASSKRLPKVLSREDAARLVQAPNIKCATGLRNRVALQLMYRCGLREAEVCALTPADVRLTEGFIFVQRGKGGKDRTVPLDAQTSALCRSWMDQRACATWFLCTTRGTKTSTAYLRNMVRRLSIETGVYIQDGEISKPVQPHILRHCCATEMLEDEFSIEDVRAILGHSSIAVTSLYLHVRPAQLAVKVRNRPPMQAVTA